MVAGIDGKGRVESIACAGLLAWITRVDGATFATELNANMENLEWLADTGVRHQHAVAAAAEKTTLLPARFGVIFLTLDSLEHNIASRKKEILASLKKIEGADEWGVKVFWTPQAPPAVRATSGKDYLQQKAQMAAANLRGSVPPDDEVHKFGEELEKLCRDSAPTGKVSAAQPGLQWQAAFLLPREKRKQWNAVLAKYAERWGADRRIEATGPWPAYTFV